MEITFALQARKDMRVVDEAEDDQDGVEFFLKVRSNITLVDLQMPHMNGIDTIVAIRQHDPKAKIIVLATYSGDAQVVRALRLGTEWFEIGDEIYGMNDWFAQGVAAEFCITTPSSISRNHRGCRMRRPLPFLLGLSQHGRDCSIEPSCKVATEY
jgi:CheY-like chemotaxis protein